MNLYRIFIIAFIASIAAMILFFVTYFSGIVSMISFAKQNNEALDNDPALIFTMLFPPKVIIALVFLIIASLVYKILGIVFIARNPNVDTTGKVFWILGFIFVSFIPAIVFMALKESKNLLATAPALPQSNTGGYQV